MLRLRNISLALTLAALFAIPASGQDVAGTWVLSVDLGPGGGGDATFVLDQNGTTITGTYSGALGDAIDVSGTADGGTVRLTFESQAGEIIYRGTVEGTTMTGTCIYGQLGDGTFEGNKTE